MSPTSPSVKDSNDFFSKCDSSFNYQSICSGNQENMRVKRVDFAFDKVFPDHFDYVCFLNAHSSYW